MTKTLIFSIKSTISATPLLKMILFLALHIVQIVACQINIYPRFSLTGFTSSVQQSKCTNKFGVIKLFSTQFNAFAEIKDTASQWSFVAPTLLIEGASDTTPILVITFNYVIFSKFYRCRCVHDVSVFVLRSNEERDELMFPPHYRKKHNSLGLAVLVHDESQD